MEAFVAYRFTGENLEELRPLLETVRDALNEAGVGIYCTFFDEEEFQSKTMGPRDIMLHAFSIIEQSDFLFVVQTSDNKSEGMLMEVGYCLKAGIPVIVATKSGVGDTYVPDMADLAITWDNHDELRQQITAIDFSTIKTKDSN